MPPRRPGPGRSAPAPARPGHRDAAPGHHADRDQPGPAPLRPGHDRDLRQGRCRPTARGGPALAREFPVTALGRAAEDYLTLRQLLGHKLADAERLLPRFIDWLDREGIQTVTIEAALAWAQRPDADPGGTVWARRLTVARGFARHMAGIDPRTEIPPAGLISY